MSGSDKLWRIQCLDSEYTTAQLNAMDSSIWDFISADPNMNIEFAQQFENKINWTIANRDIYQKDIKSASKVVTIGEKSFAYDSSSTESSSDDESQVAGPKTGVHNESTVFVNSDEGLKIESKRYNKNKQREIISVPVPNERLGQPDVIKTMKLDEYIKMKIAEEDKPKAMGTNKAIPTRKISEISKEAPAARFSFPSTSKKEKVFRKREYEAHILINESSNSSPENFNTENINQSVEIAKYAKYRSLLPNKYYDFKTGGMTNMYKFVDNACYRIFRKEPTPAKDEFYTYMDANMDPENVLNDTTVSKITELFMRDKLTCEQVVKFIDVINLKVILFSKHADLYDQYLAPYKKICDEAIISFIENKETLIQELVMQKAVEKINAKHEVDEVEDYHDENLREIMRGYTGY